MSKKTNTLLFILGATLFNVIVAIISFIVFAVLYARFIMNLVPESSHSWSLFLLFLASIAVSFVVYRYVLKFLIKKIDIEKYFDPLFARRYKKK